MAPPVSIAENHLVIASGLLLVRQKGAADHWRDLQCLKESGGNWPRRDHLGVVRGGRVVIVRALKCAYALECALRLRKPVLIISSGNHEGTIRTLYVCSPDRQQAVSIGKRQGPPHLCFEHAEDCRIRADTE